MGGIPFVRAQLYEQKYAMLNRVLLVGYFVVAIWGVAAGLYAGDSYAAFQGALGAAMIPLPKLAARIFRVTIPQDCRLLYHLFCFCTIIVGSAFYGYTRIPYWDKVFHFLSGLLVSMAGVIVCQGVLGGLRGSDKLRRRLFMLFAFLFNLAVAAIWEVYEYLCLVLFGIDAVNNVATGVHDTMQDIIVCLLGGILFLGLLLRYFRTGKRSFLIGVCFHFYDLRGQSFKL